MEYTKALNKIDSRTIFAPYFKGRWQNMQNIVNDSVFYSLVPEPYLTYYQAYIKQWLEWSTGFVPMLHRSDFFATGMGYTVCDIFARECMSGGFRVDARDESTTAFMGKWADKVLLKDILNQAFFFSNAGGNAILCLTPVNGELVPNVYPINRVLFEGTRDGKVTQALILNRFVGGANSMYYAREYRIQIDGRNYYKVDLSVSHALATVPDWGQIYVEDVPISIKSAWANAYGDIQPGKWYELPLAFQTLGLYNIRNKSVAVALSDLPGYADSTLHTALDILYSIDYNYTCFQIDQYWGRTRVFLPKQMNTKRIKSDTVGLVPGVTFEEAIQQPALSEEVYVTVGGDSVDEKPIEPTFIQPDIRAEMRRLIRDSDLELLASKVGLSSSTLANHLTYNSDKTATEVRAEQDTTETSVNNKRDLANNAINPMLADVARFYGFDESVNISWNRAGVNTATENSQLLEDYSRNTLPLREYLKRRWSDLTDAEIDSWIAELDAQEQKRSQSLFGEVGASGIGGVNETVY